MSNKDHEALPANVGTAIERGKTFGERLIISMSLIHVGSEALAGSVDVSFGTVSGWRTDTYMPKPEPLNRLSAELGVPKGLLLYGQGRSMRARLSKLSGLGDLLFKALKELSTGKTETQVEEELKLELGTLKEFIRELWRPHRQGDLLLWLVKDPAVPEVTNTLFVRQLGWGQQFDLTTREVHTLRLLLEGKANTAISESLGVSRNEVGRDIANLKVKLGLSRKGRSIATLVDTALGKGFPTERNGEQEDIDEVQRNVFLFTQGRFQWPGINLATRRFLAQSLADYLDKPIAQLNTEDFTIRLLNLGFKSLRGLLSYYQSDGLSRSESLGKLIKDLGHSPTDEDQRFIDSLSSGRLRDWSAVPKSVRLKMLGVLAKHLGKPVTELGLSDLYVQVPEFGNKTLSGLKGLYDRNSSLPAMVAIQRDLGIRPPSWQKLGPAKALESLRLGRFRRNQTKWRNTSLAARRHLLTVLATHLGKPLGLLNTSDLRQKIPLFNNRSLVGLLNMYRKHLDSTSHEPALIELKRDLGIADERPVREPLLPAELSYEDMDEVVENIGDPYTQEDDATALNFRSLQRQEELRLADLIQKGNRTAYWVLVGSQHGYLRWRAQTILHGYGIVGEDIRLEEMVEAGERLLQQSALRYRPIKGATLRTFAWRMIGREMHKAVARWNQQMGVELDDRRAAAPKQEEVKGAEEVAAILDEITIHSDPDADALNKSIFLSVLTGGKVAEVAASYRVKTNRVTQAKREVTAALRHHRSKLTDDGER